MKHLLLAVAVLGGLTACSRSGEPEAVLEELVRVGETGRCDRVPELITKAGRDMMGPTLEAGCKAAYEQSKGKTERKLKRMNVVNKTEDGDKVTVRAEPEFEDGSKEPAQDFVLVKEDGQWRIDLLATSAGMAAGAGVPK
jgi:hypothetical protein